MTFSNNSKLIAIWSCVLILKSSQKNTTPGENSHYSVTHTFLTLFTNLTNKKQKTKQSITGNANHMYNVDDNIRIKWLTAPYLK